MQRPPFRDRSHDLRVRVCFACFVPILVLHCLIGSADAASSPDYIVAAVSDAARPESDRVRDDDRKPADVLAFAGIKPGDKVADFMPGRGYFTKIICKAVGEAGHVYAVSVPRAGASQTTARADPIAPACANVTEFTLAARNYPAPELYDRVGDPGAVYEYWAMRLPAESFIVAEPLDVIWTSENYHDLHNKSLGSPDMALVNEALFKALKPGGVLIIEDHAAAKGSRARDTERLHRIDPEEVKREVIAAGFEWVDESSVLHHPDDPHIAKAHEMHDRTDRFLLKFRKP